MSAPEGYKPAAPERPDAYRIGDHTGCNRCGCCCYDSWCGEADRLHPWKPGAPCPELLVDADGQAACGLLLRLEGTERERLALMLGVGCGCGRVSNEGLMLIIQGGLRL